MFCSALQGIGHTQQQTPVISDNSIVNSFVHSEIGVKHSKCEDMEIQLVERLWCTTMFYHKI